MRDAVIEALFVSTRNAKRVAFLAQVCLLSLLSPMPAVALDDGLARTPPMGWNSWNRFHCNVSEQLIEETADAMASSGMKDAGYEYVVIDDCWQVSRDDSGTIVADPERFPNGIAAVADYVHSRGLKFGIYTDAGTETCQHRPGSYGYEELDARTYASWGVDYVKDDWCSTTGLDPRVQYAAFRDAIIASGRPMVLSLSVWGREGPWAWGPLAGHLWRTTGDISDNWARMLALADSSSNHAGAAVPGAWNDPDMLEVGNGHMTADEYRVHLSLWAIMAAPLIAGNDLRTMSEETRAMLTNPEVIVVDQDALGIQGIKVSDDGAGLQVWFKPLQGSGARAVALVNRSDAEALISADWNAIGLAAGPASVRDLWRQEDLGTASDSFSAIVPSHGVTFVSITGTDPPIPARSSYLSDLTWSHQAQGWGMLQRDQSIEGRPITLNGTTYPKGLGAHSPSTIEFRLNGACSLFESDIGVDDEVGSRGSVIFQVWADGAKLYESGLMTGGADRQSFSIDVSGMNEMRLVVNAGPDDINYDHADWANARVTCAM
jgi:alpha-galactosidase